MWTRQFQQGFDAVNGVYVDTIDENIYAVGIRNGYPYLIKYTSNGDYVWDYNFNVPSITNGEGFDVAVNSVGDVVTGGRILGRFPGEDYTGYDAFLAYFPHDQPPVVNAGVDREGNERQSIIFDDSISTDVNGDITGYVWDFGDGNTGNGQTVQHAYQDSGTYIVKLTVVDSVGFSGSDTVQVIVLEIDQILDLNPAQVWMGLKNSDDVGIKFDLLAEVYKGSNLITSGQLDSIPGGSSGFNNANLHEIPLVLPSPIDFPQGSVLSIKVYVRNACVGSGKNSGQARLWFNDSAANTQFGATIAGDQGNWYLLDNFVLSSNAGLGPKVKIDVAAGARCSPFKLFGTWNVNP